MKRIGVVVHFWDETGNDKRGTIKKWSQPNGKPIL